MFYLSVQPNEICPSINTQCAAGQSPEIFMKVFYNPTAIQISPSDQLKGMEHNAVCTTGVTTNCLAYGAQDPILVNQIKSSQPDNANKVVGNYVLFRCSQGYTTCS